MADIVKITKGQPFALFVPLVILNADGTKESVEADSITGTSVVIKGDCSSEQTIKPLAHEHFLVLQLPEDLKVAVYAVTVTAQLATGRQFTLRIQRAFEVVNWDWQSNWRDYIVGDHIELTDQPFIAGVFNTDAELEELKEEWREKNSQLAQAIAEAEAAKEEWERKAEELDDVARETTSQQILTTVEETAKQGTDPTATNTAIKELIINEGIERANEYAAEIREIIGDWNNE